MLPVNIATGSTCEKDSFQISSLSPKYFVVFLNNIEAQ